MAPTGDAEERLRAEGQAAERALALWRLNAELTIVQASLLMLERDPGGEDGYVERWQAHERPSGYEAVKHAITTALVKGELLGQVTPLFLSDISRNRMEGLEGTVDVEKSRVEVKSLKSWLREQGVTTGFFFHASAATPDYLDPKHPRYAPKLAAAVRAWSSVSDPKGKTPKAALTKWLRENSAAYGLSDEEGKPNELGIEECAKVANWQPGGGAPRTPN